MASAYNNPYEDNVAAKKTPSPPIKKFKTAN